MSTYPDPETGTPNSMWFYERARGSYAEIGPGSEKVQICVNGTSNPKKQKFDKILLSKVQNTERGLPHIVSLGAQKSFANYMVHIEELKNDGVEIEVDKHAGTCS